MTSADPQDPQETGQPEEESQPEEPLLYCISFDRLAELNRSAVALVAERRGPSCPSLAKPIQELTNPRELVQEIAKFSAEDEGFIRTTMGIQEIVFRTLLARRNQPTLLTDLHHELTERWSTPIRPINITEDGLRRIMEADDFYGFARVSP